MTPENKSHVFALLDAFNYKKMIKTFFDTLITKKKFN